VALTKVTGQVINDTTGLVVGVTTVGGGLSATDGFFSGIVTAVGDASFSGNVSVGGTLTYEDVTNIDAVGLVTARNGIVVGSGITLSKDGDIFATGVTTSTTFSGAFTGSGANITALNATQLTSGTIPDARFPATLPAISGANLTGVAATDNVRTGILDVAGVSTFRNTMNVGAAVTISESGIEASGIGITVANINGGQVGGRRNIVINGAMNVSQRGSSFSQVANNEITVDRFGLIHPYSTNFDVSQSTDSPDGFSKSYKLDINVVDSSIGSGQYVAIRQRIEAQDLQQLAFGTSAAKPITLSFYVRSNKTGTFAINIQQTDNSSKQVSAPYTISSANTWERKTFTFAGDTSGVINDDTGTGLTVIWWISAGSTYNSGTSRSTFTTHADADAAVGCNVNILDSTDNNFYLTGVQLEVGSEATAFEHRSFGEELQLCKRYFNMYSRTHADSGDEAIIANGFYWSSTRFMAPLRFDVPMRTNSWSLYKVTGSSYFRIYNNGGGSHGIDDFGLNGQAHVSSAHLNIDSGLSSSGDAGVFFTLNTAARIGFDAEL